jgi:hypothetical protein
MKGGGKGRELKPFDLFQLFSQSLSPILGSGINH